MSPCAFYFTDTVSKSNSTVHFLSGALVFTTILLIVLAFSVLTIYNRKKCHCKGNSFFSFLFKPERYYCFVSQMTIFYLHFETESQIISTTDITPEAVSIIGMMSNNCESSFSDTFTHKLSSPS